MLHEWRIQDIERKADKADRRLHELDSLQWEIDSLKNKEGQQNDCIDRLRSTLEICLSRIEQLEQIVIELDQKIISQSIHDNH